MYYDATLKDWYRIKRLNNLTEGHVHKYDFLDALDLARAEYELEMKEHTYRLNKRLWVRSLKASG